jgi:two-component system, NarL family, nitrate/nitrite response regulator NarL
VNYPPISTDSALNLVPCFHDLQRGEVCRYPIRLFLANPESLLNWGLRTLLQHYARHIQVVGEVHDLISAQDQIVDSHATVLLVDSSLLKSETFPVLNALLNNGTAQVLLMADASEEWLKREMIAQGVRGVVEKRDPPDRLFRGIEALHNGETWLNPNWLSLSVRQLSPSYDFTRDRSARARIASLTPTELETVRMMFKHAGQKNHVVAMALNISPATLRNRLSVIYNKLDVAGKAGLILFVTQNGLDLK